MSPSFLWAMAPATDILVPYLQRFLAEKIADVLVAAYRHLQPAKMNVGITQLIGVTQNRRADISPYLKPGTNPKLQKLEKSCFHEFLTWNRNYRPKLWSYQSR